MEWTCRGKQVWEPLVFRLSSRIVLLISRVRQCISNLINMFRFLQQEMMFWNKCSNICLFHKHNHPSTTDYSCWGYLHVFTAACQKMMSFTLLFDRLWSDRWYIWNLCPGHVMTAQPLSMVASWEAILVMSRSKDQQSESENSCHSNRGCCCLLSRMRALVDLCLSCSSDALCLTWTGWTETHFCVHCCPYLESSTETTKCSNWGTKRTAPP